jgi:hypothetical protein
MLIVPPACHLIPHPREGERQFTPAQRWDHPRKGNDARRLPEPAEAVNSPDDSDLGGQHVVVNRRTSHRPGRALRSTRGLIIFASVLLLVLSFFNLIDGIAAVANSHVFIGNAHYVFGNLRTWGWITLIIGVLQLLAAGGILAGNQLARWFAVALVGLNAISQMFFIPAYPFWSLTIIAVDVVVLWGCASTVAARTWPHSDKGDDADPAERHAGPDSERYANTRLLKDNRREITDLRDHVHGAGGQHAA